jgi:hypothetical protein
MSFQSLRVQLISTLQTGAKQVPMRLPIRARMCLFPQRRRRARPEISTDASFHESVKQFQWDIADRRLNPEDHYIELEKHRRLQSAISKLPWRYRHVVESRQRSEASIKEIAQGHRHYGRRDKVEVIACERDVALVNVGMRKTVRSWRTLMVQVRFVHWASGRVTQRTPVPQTQNATYKEESWLPVLCG